MLMPVIEYVDTDRRHFAACPNVPAFHFSTKVTVFKPKAEYTPPPPPPLHILDKSSLRMPWPKPKVRAKNTPGKEDPDWNNYKTKFSSPPPKHDHRPMNTAPTLEGLGHFIERIEEITAIAKTQYMELPTLAQELAFSGIKSSSFSKGKDDENEAGNFLASSTMTPYRFANMDPDEMDLLDRIEWEKYIHKCSQSVRIGYIRKEDGTIKLHADHAGWTKEQVVPFAIRIKQMQGDRTPEELLNARARCAYYKKPVTLALIDAGLMKSWNKRTVPVRMYLDPADDNTSRLYFEVEEGDYDDPEEPGFPVEIGFDDGIWPFEPTEYDLWELTPREQRFGVMEIATAIRLANEQHAIARRLVAAKGSEDML